jgi:hypothetical protein
MKQTNRTIRIIYVIFILLFLLMMVNYVQTQNLLQYTFFISCIVFAYVKRKKIRELWNKIPREIQIIMMVVLIIIGIIARIMLLYANYKPPESDYETFYNNAVAFSQSGHISYTRYYAIFPYLTPYSSVLGLFFRFFGTKYSNVVIFNIIIDVLSAVVLFFTFRKKHNLKRSLILPAIWLINPISIIWCAFVSPITIVNLLFVICVGVFELREKIVRKYMYILVSILLGVVLAIGNLFRPIFIVFVIAIVMYEIYKLLFTKNRGKINSIIGIIAILVCYFTTISLGNVVIQKIVGLDISHTAGWTIYVGANMNSYGTSNVEDTKVFQKKHDEEPFSAEKIQVDFKDKAIERIRNNGAKGNYNLLINKFQVLTGYIAQYSYASLEYAMNLPNTTQSVKVREWLRNYAHIYMFILVFLNLFTYFWKISKKNSGIIVYYLLCIGLVISHLFVEAHGRYTVHIIVPMSIILIYNLTKKNDNVSN